MGSSPFTRTSCSPREGRGSHLSGTTNTLSKAYKGCSPREGRGSHLCKTEKEDDDQRVAVPVRGAGRILNELMYDVAAIGVAVPVRGAGRISPALILSPTFTI